MAKSSEVIFDSNVWLGYLRTNDSLHTQATAIIEEYRTHSKLIPEYVVVEVVSVLKKYEGPRVAQQCLDIFQNTAGYEIFQSPQLFTDTCTEFAKLREKHLSFVDVSLLCLSRTTPVITLDKKLAKAIASQ